jgi:hypothetical protein
MCPIPTRCRPLSKLLRSKGVCYRGGLGSAFDELEVGGRARSPPLHTHSQSDTMPSRDWLLMS